MSLIKTETLVETSNMKLEKEYLGDYWGTFFTVYRKRKWYDLIGRLSGGSWESVNTSRSQDYAIMYYLENIQYEQ